jgi:predicted ATPase
MVVGEPGIGKTRLTEEFSVYAKLRGAEVLLGRCYEGGVSVPYLPFIEAFRQHVRTRPDEELRAELGAGAPEVAALVSEVRARFPDLPESREPESEADRLRLFESMAGFVRSASAATPLVLVLDDLHWADKPTLLLMQHLARGIRNDRVLIVGTYRDVELERTHPLAEVVAALRRERLYERILLRGLPADDVQALISAIADQEVPDEFAQAISRETEGNPFFIEEVLRHLAETGAISRSEAGWVGDASLIEESLPEGVREVIGRRLSRLSEACNGMLTIASAMPGGFSFEVLNAVSEEAEENLLDLIDEALRSRVIVERKEAGGVYEFTHALIRQTLYGELNTPRRVRLHRQIGEALERLYAANPEPHLSELAQHFFQAAPGGDVAKAVDYAVRAGERALAMTAYEEAADHYERALQALDLGEQQEGARRCELVLSLGNARLRGGETEKARETFRTAADLARDLSSAELLARAAVGYGGGFGVAEMGTVNQSIVGLLEEGLAAIGTEDSWLRARLLSLLATQLYFSDDRQRCAELSEEAVAVARRVGDKKALIQTLYSLVLSLSDATTSPAVSLETCTEMVELATELGDRESLAFAHSFRVISQLFHGRIDEFDRDMEIHTKLAEQTRQPLRLWLGTVHEGMRATLEGRFEEGERLAQEALSIGQPVEGQNAVTVFGVQNFQLRWATGSGFEELEPAVRLFVEQYPALPAWRASLAIIYAELGRETDARREFEWFASKEFGGLPDDGNWLITLVLLADTCLFLRDAPRASILYERMLPFSGSNVVVGPSASCTGALDRNLGYLAATMSRWDKAVEHFERALEMNERIRSRPYVARTRFEYANMLLERNEPGDLEKAVPLLNQALDTAQELGMKGLLEKALALKFRAQGVDSGEVRSSIYAVASIVDRQRPDLIPHAAPDGTVTLMFSDMEGFTSMTERLGDHRAHEIVQDHNRIVREQLGAHEGYEVELQGDGFLLAFASARKAALCAIGIQRAFAAYNDGEHEQPIRVRIGLHTGETIKDADKFFGKAVIQACRIADQARAGEILVSSVLKTLVESSGDLPFRPAREVELKGLSGTHQLYGIDWSS